MHFRRVRRGPLRAGVVTAALTAATCGLASPALATGPVSPAPASGTPYLATSNSQQSIKQLVQCGNTMYAVGRIWKVLQNGSTYWRNNMFSFSASAPYTMSSLNVDVNGIVNSIAFTSGGGCGHAYIGGTFTKVNGQAANNIAEINTSTGALVTSFGHSADSTVETVTGFGSHLLVGGQFTEINGSNHYRYVSLSPTTGKNDGFINLHVAGWLAGSDQPGVYHQQLSHTGNLMLVEGNFTSVSSQRRQQIFMVNLNGPQATLTKWTSPEFNQECVSVENYYIRAAAWSPDDSTVYVADTGDHLINRKQGSYPLTGLCDAAAAFPATQTTVSHKWIDYTGCDSYYSVAADDGAVYVAGHPRWADNPDGCNFAGPGAIADPGLQGLDPGTGHVQTSGGSPVYSMSRANADDMLITSAGLWIASTNRYGSNWCSGATNHSGICLLPYPTG